MKMQVQSFIRNLGSTGKSLSEEACAVRLREGWRHTGSEFRRVVYTKTWIEDRNRNNTAAGFKGIRLPIGGGELMRGKNGL